MKIQDLTEQHLREVHRIYELTCGELGKPFEKRMLSTPGEVLKDLRNLRSGNYVIGSNYSNSSRLVIKTSQNGALQVTFDPQCRDPNLLNESLDTKDNLEASIRSYFQRVSRESKK